MSVRPQERDLTRLFRRLDEDAYELSILEAGDPYIVFTVHRLRREHDELHGEVTVETAIAGAQTNEGMLSIGDLNLSSQRARTERATYLLQRSKDGESDWRGLLDDFAQKVLAAERNGQPAVDLRTLPRPEPDDVFDVEGFCLPRRHPSILFGDGGAAKSYLLLYYLGYLARRGFRVALFDWELCGEDHRDRLERLFGPEMPAIAYAKCEKPLHYEQDRLRRLCRELSIDYAGYDSVAFACDGPPEAAEVAGRYFRAVRRIGPGSLHVAHVNKSDTGDQKPFGSTFWHNGARSTWFAKRTEANPGAKIEIGLYNRKANLGPLLSAVGFELDFSAESTQIRRISVSRVPELASKLPIRQRITDVLRGGALSAGEIAERIDEDVESVRRTVRRWDKQFARLKDGTIGLFDNNLH